MNQRTLLGRLLSPAGFGLVLIFFLMPFLTVSCGTATDSIDTTFSGIGMVVGSPPSIGGPGLDAATEQELAGLLVEEVDLEPLALLSALAVLGGLAVGLIQQRRLRFGFGVGLALLAGALVTAAVLRAPSRVADFVARLGDGSPTPEPLTTDVHARYGFYLAVVTLGALVVGNGIALVRTQREPPPEPDPGPLAGAPEVLSGDDLESPDRVAADDYLS
jgi:hypothetical protein